MAAAMDEERVPALLAHAPSRDFGQGTPTGIRVLIAILGSVSLLGFCAGVAFKQGNTVAAVTATAPTPVARWDIGGIFGALNHVEHHSTEVPEHADTAETTKQHAGTSPPHQAKPAAPEESRAHHLSRSRLGPATDAAPKAIVSKPSDTRVQHDARRNDTVPSSSGNETTAHKTPPMARIETAVQASNASAAASGGATLHLDTPVQNLTGNGSDAENVTEPQRPSLSALAVIPNKTASDETAGDKIASNKAAGNTTVGNPSISNKTAGDKHSKRHCKGGSLAACECLFACKIFGGQSSQCSGSKVELLDGLVQKALHSFETACLGMQCIVRCSKTLGCYDEKVQDDCRNLANQSSWRRFSGQSNQSMFLSKHGKHDNDGCHYECEADGVDVVVK